MRKYQRRAVNELAELYRSNDPLRYVYIANKLGVDRRMTPREFRIFKRRMFATFKRMGVALNDAVKNIVGAVSKAAQSFADMVTAMKTAQQRDLGSIAVHRIPNTVVPIGNLRVASTVDGLKDAPIIGNITDLQITVDETEHV